MRSISFMFPSLSRCSVFEVERYCRAFRGEGWEVEEVDESHSLEARQCSGGQSVAFPDSE